MGEEFTDLLEISIPHVGRRVLHDHECCARVSCGIDGFSVHGALLKFQAGDHIPPSYVPLVHTVEDDGARAMICYEASDVRRALLYDVVTIGLTVVEKAERRQIGIKPMLCRWRRERE